MITEMRKLKAECKKCRKRADFEIIKPTDDLPDSYWKGVRSESYCTKHLPKEAKAYWNYNLIAFGIKAEL